MSNRIKYTHFILLPTLSFLFGFVIMYALIVTDNKYVDRSIASIKQLNNKIDNNKNAEYLEYTEAKNDNQNIIMGKSIIADLNNMKVLLLQDGKEVNSFNIVSIGKPGSFYETPAGNYKIELKEKNHFSSIGKVYMPYSMQFFGNFFIHGIPYHEDGERVTSAYSGGCIRMQDADALIIYNFAESKTPIQVIRAPKYSDKEYSDDLLTKEMNINIMVSIISLEVINQNKILSEEYGNIKDSLNVMFDKNDNNIANEIANFYGRNNFVKKMNEKALAIGLNSTKYSSTNYSDVNNITTTEDKIKLLNYIKNNKSYIYNIIEKIN